MTIKCLTALNYCIVIWALRSLTYVDIRGGVLEACRYYSDLCKEGAALKYIDLGGGLAVDYTGKTIKHRAKSELLIS